jgi:L-lysine 2,3-aminomutase
MCTAFVMWGLQSNLLRIIKWKGSILEQLSNQLHRIKIERYYTKLISYLFS